MTGITLIETSAKFKGRNVIQNNRNTEGAGITMISKNSNIRLYGELFMINNTADKKGILVKQTLPGPNSSCSIVTYDNSSSVTFSGNRAGQGGSDMYGAILMGCDDNDGHTIPHVGHRNETSWYFDTPLIEIFHFNNTDRLSSMSSDPIMVCFCNNSNLPDCSDRTHHMQTYPGLEINTSIATVGYYGGTSTGQVMCW